MGSIASVLQWHCQTCGQINPTESVKCLKCGIKRISGHDSDIQKRYHTGDSSSEYASRTEKSEGTTPGSEAIIIPTTNNFNSGWSCVGSAPLASRSWRCGCGLRNVSASWRCAACDKIASHAPVYRLSDDEDQSSGMTDKNKSDQDHSMIRSNTLAVPSYKPSSSYSGGPLNLDVQSLRLSPTQITDHAHGVTRSLSHGSVINSQHKWWNVDETRSTINRPTSLLVSERYGTSSYNPRESFLRSLHTVTRRPKKCNESKSNWELNYVKEYQREQTRGLHLKKWACSKCTLENSGIRTHCEACLSPRISPLARVSNTRGLSVTTLGRHETLSGKDGATSLPTSGGIMITVPDWPQTENNLGDSFQRSISAQNSPETRPTYRRSFSEQTSETRPVGKVISSRRSLNDYQKSLASYCNTLTKSDEVSEKKIDESNAELIDKECSWDTNAEGVIYALPNKGKYKDLNLQLQVNNNGTRYSYVSVQDTKTVMSNSQNEVLYSNDMGDGDYARIDELLGAENCISPVGDSNIRTSHIGAGKEAGKVYNMLPSVGKVSHNPRESAKVPTAQQASREGVGAGATRMWQCGECWFAYNAWGARCDVCRSARAPHAVTLAPGLERDARSRHNSSSEASGKQETNRNEPPKKLTVPIAALDHDLNSDELLFAVESTPPPETSWTCVRCTLDNEPEDSSCAACAASRPTDNYWSCSSCTLRNPISWRVCRACKTPPVPRHGPPAAADNNIPFQRILRPEPAEWSCSECTYVNSGAALACDMCQSPRARLLPAAPDQASLDDDDSPEGSDGERQDSTPMEILRLREESHAWAQWQEVMAQCAATGEMYVDESFPAAARSLYYGGG
ncbi:Calpain-D, partial [Danaus plexippus plexippus]